MHLRILLFQSRLSQLRRWHGKRPGHNAFDRHPHAHHLGASLRSKFRTKDALSRSVPSTRRLSLEKVNVSNRGRRWKGARRGGQDGQLFSDKAAKCDLNMNPRESLVSDLWSPGSRPDGRYGDIFRI